MHVLVIVALVVFGVGALGGLILANFVLRKEFAPWAVGGTHALLGTVGLVLLLLIFIGGHTQHTRVIISFVLFAAAALGGFVLGTFHLRSAHPPKMVVVIHAFLAILGLLTLLSLVL